MKLLTNQNRLLKNGSQKHFHVGGPCCNFNYLEVLVFGNVQVFMCVQISYSIIILYRFKQVFGSLEELKKELLWLKSFLGAPITKKGNGKYMIELILSLVVSKSYKPLYIIYHTH